MKKVKLFKKSVRHYQKKLSLLNWDIHVFSQDKPGTRASAYWEFSNKTCSICWSKSWMKENPSKKEIRKVAFHEVCEILLAEVTDKLNIHHSIDITEEIVHNIIRVMENNFKNI